MICIVDYKVGNSRSIQNMVNRAGHEAIISNNHAVIKSAERLILPGVGHFAKSMELLKEFDLINLLNDEVLDQKKPILGICLGMQMMTRYSEEGDCEGLGWIEASTVKFKNEIGMDIRIPHMGWNSVEFVQSGKITKDMPDPSRFYFVHSFFVKCDHKRDVLSLTHHGQKFVSAFKKDNIIGVQFHPEKSHRFGLTLIRNFCNTDES